ncbi:MAG TPA: hypothetical protein VFR38_18060 [Gaiellaceae bacterium]|nr:hypothetical protein [Gaiellaceae bacterium]
MIVACAISAGIHAVLVPEHFTEAAGAGIGFGAAAVLLAAAVLGLTLRPASPVLYPTAALLLAGLLTAYLFTVTSGLPVLQPQPEAVDPLALVTKAVEAVGLAAACRLAWQLVPRGSNLRQKGTLA